MDERHAREPLAAGASRLSPILSWAIRASTPRSRPRRRTSAPSPLVATDDLRAAMRKDRAPHQLRTAPVELGADRSVTNPDCTPPADYRPGHRCAVADIEVDSAQCRRRIADRDNVGYIECASPVGSNAVADGGSADRMLDWKRLERDPAHIDGFAFRHNLALADRIRREQLPCLGCRIDGTGRPGSG